MTSMRTDAHRSPEWWREAVIYHVYPRSFRDTNSDGFGDLRGVIRSVDYLAWLGIDALWLSPFYVSPGIDFGYDVADHCSVDPAMGTLEDFDELLAACHARGIRVLLDFVSSNTSIEHPWFADSRSSRDSARRDWYIWADPAPDGGVPNNWLAIFGGSAWTLDATTGQYYLHSFLKEIPDLNWRNPAVEEAMLDVLRFWLDRGVDGFRIDAAEHPLKDPLLRDNPPADKPGGDAPEKNLGAYDGQRHLHDRGHPDIHPLYRRVRKLLDTHRPGNPAFAIAEVVPEPGLGLAHWASFFGEDLDEIHLPLNLTLPALPWSARAFETSIRRLHASLPTGGWPSLVLGSHDEPHVAGRYDRRRATALMVLLLTCGGTPVLYAGDELALPNSPVPPGEERDPWGRKNPEFNRDLGRTPIPWSRTEPNAGFTTAEEPWLPMAAGSSSMSVEAQAGETGSPLQLTRRLLALRKHRASLRTGSLEWLSADDDVLAYRRRQGFEVTEVFINFGTRAATIDALGELELGTEPTVTMGGGQLMLPRHSAAVTAYVARA